MECKKKALTGDTQDKDKIQLHDGRVAGKGQKC